MKVLHLSTFDTAGGAARAAYRVHQGLCNLGVDSQMLVRAKSSNDPTVLSPTKNIDKITARLRADLNKLPLRNYPQANRSGFSSQWVPDAIHAQVKPLNPDLINLHWVSNGYLQIESVAKFGKPIVWTLMDMWPFTGGCHYSYDCDRYTQTCGACPQLRSQKQHDLSRQTWQRKAKAWKDTNLTIVAPSSWLAQCARNSSLFKHLRIEVIPFGLNTQVFKPVNKKTAREILGLPQEKYLILFGAVEATKDSRKGFQLLQAALQKLGQTHLREKVEVVVFGSSQPQDSVDLGFSTQYLGRLQDDISLMLNYSAADVMIVPSTQEAFGQTASEALACGTPVVAFDGTGVMDIVEHLQNGYLAKPFEIDDLAHGIAWVLEDHERLQKLCLKAREKAEQEFALELQARRYLTLFKEILQEA